MEPSLTNSSFKNCSKVENLTQDSTECLCSDFDSTEADNHRSLISDRRMSSTGKYTDDDWVDDCFLSSCK